MNRSSNATTRRTVGVVASVVALAGTAFSGAGPAAAATAPTLTLETSRSSVTLTRYGDNELFGDLGVYAVAGKKPFEVRATRSSYAQPIVANLVRSGPDLVLPTPEDFNGLSGFATITWTDAAGKVVAKTTSAFCPNTYQPVRRSPDAPATSPYPDSCAGNPYALGGVWGIQAGYAVPLINTYGYKGSNLPNLAVGSYTASVTVRSDYRKTLGLSAAQGTSKIAVTVQDAPDCAAAGCKQPASVGVARTTSARAGSTARVAAAAPKAPTGKASAPTGPLPDLRSLPAWGIDVSEGRYLQFSATVWNGGPGRLVVDGFRTTDDPDRMDAYQYYFTAAGKQVGYTRAGGMEWDPREGHEHWHFQNFATYQLLDADKKLVVRSQKEAFCLANTDAVDYTVDGATWKPDNTDLRTACGERTSLGVREVLDTGSGDTYVQSLPGQSFDLNGLANGTYYIQVLANPAKVLHEASTTNNSSLRKVVIGGTAGSRTVTVAKVGIITEPPVDNGE